MINRAGFIVVRVSLGEIRAQRRAWVGRCTSASSVWQAYVLIKAHFPRSGSLKASSTWSRPPSLSLSLSLALRHHALPWRWPGRARFWPTFPTICICRLATFIAVRCKSPCRGLAPAPAPAPAPTRLDSLTVFTHSLSHAPPLAKGLLPPLPN